MTAKLLKRYWGQCSADSLREIHAGAQRCVGAFAEVTRSSGSLIQEWLEGRPMVAFDHYPDQDVVDPRTGYQFYYHAHRHAGQEHGHLHLFWHATRSGRRRYPRAGRGLWSRASPTHLIAISLDARGLPLGFFTVNQWVTDGYWFDAETMSRAIAKFRVSGDALHAQSSLWLTGFVQMYRPLIDSLLVKRDERLSRAADPSAAREDHRLEVLSAARIDWVSDLNELERIAVWRGCVEV